MAAVCAATVNIGFAARVYCDFVNAMPPAACSRAKYAWLLSGVEGAGERLVWLHAGTFGEKSADELAVVGG